MNKKRVFSYLLLLGTPMQFALADLNVLVIGQGLSSSDGVRAPLPVKGFNPTKIVSEFTKILEGGSHGKVKVSLEQSYGRSDKKHPHKNLFSWFHYPYPADVEAASRWPNLRGELDTKWDYVVLLGDTYCIENLPGFYALGVSEIGKEVAKGKAETVLLMPWPTKKSTSTVDHYKEVVYRVGRSGGYAVAPAGLAWEASKKDNNVSQHPSDEGAYLAAATLYSRLFGKSAASSEYEYNDKLADLSNEVVSKNKGAVQYEGRFATPHPHSMQFNHTRMVQHSITGTSTERGHLTMIKKVMDACLVDHDNYFSHRYETNNPGNEKSGWPTKIAGPIEAEAPISFNIGKFGFYPHDEFKVNPDYWKRAYTFQYQGRLVSNDHAAEMISVHDFRAAHKALDDAPHLGATIPRSSWAMLERIHPGLKLNGSGNHLSKIAILPNASYIYSCDSGRCPLTPEVDEPTAEWHAMRVGYEAAWVMGNLQVRAPGFRVLPSTVDTHEINNFNTGKDETMSVNFIFKPKAPVTVSVTSSHPELVEISPSELTFTQENHDTPQAYTVRVKKGAASAESAVSINVSTTSADEVYNNLNDKWQYTAKSVDLQSPPKAVADTYRVKVGAPLLVNASEGVLANDGVNRKNPVTKLSVEKPPAHGTLTLANNGSFKYAAKAGYSAKDSFTYKATNKNGKSEAVTVNLQVSDQDPSLILRYDFEKMDNGVVKDSSGYGRDGLIKQKIDKVEGLAKGNFAADLTKGTIDIPIDQDFYDLIDERVSIAFWGYVKPIEKGVSKNILLNASQTYGDKIYESLKISFESRMNIKESRIHWQNGIQTADNGANTLYKIVNTQKHSKAKIPLNPELLDGKWVHWTFTRNRDGNGNFTVYKDGVLAFTGGLAGLNAYGLIDEMDTLTMGKSYNGMIDDFRIYNRELSTKEIAEVMKN